METTQDVRKHDLAFSTRLGLIFSCMGCMVGTGNIWRFPRIVAENSDGEGCLVFILVWLLFLFLWSIPMLLIEYAIGRYTGKDVLQSFREFLGDSTLWMGGWITLVPVIVGFWYSVVLGWSFFYTVHCLVSPLPVNETESKAVFDNFALNSNWPVLTHGLATLIAAVSVIKGGKTIEKVNLCVVPIFLTLILFTFFWAVSQKYADHGLRFLFAPNWEALLNPRTFVDALCQNAFDTGAGMGLMVAYSTYMSRRDGVVRFAMIIPMCNNLISLVCGMSVFSIVFSVLKTTEPGINKTEIVDIIRDSGPASTGLTFIWLPVLFSSVGSMGRALAVLYFLCLSFAGITSMLPYLEVAAQTLENVGVSRKYGVPLCFCFIFLGGLPSALSITFLTNQDFVWAFALVISGLMFQSVVIKFGTSKFRKNVINDYGENDWYLPKIWEWTVKFIAPLEALLALVWWAVDVVIKNIKSGIPWYRFGPQNLTPTLVQWAVLLSILGGINLAVIHCQSKTKQGADTEWKPLEGTEDESSLSDYGAIESTNADKTS